MLLAGFQLGAGNQSHMEAHAAIITVAAAADGDDDDAVATAVSEDGAHTPRAYLATSCILRQAFTSMSCC